MNDTISFEYITLERTGCLGPCPSYTLKINSSGEISYHGMYFVRLEGNHIWNIRNENIRLLDKAIIKCNYLHFTRGEFDDLAVITDTPSCITSVKMKNGDFRTITRHHDPDSKPSQLEVFENEVESISGVKKYIS